MENHRIIQVEDKVPLKLLIPLSIQHMFAMFGASVLVPFLFGINPAVVLFMNGVGTLLFIAVTKGKAPAYLGSSFAFLAPAGIVIETMGYEYALGGFVVVGFCGCILAFIVYKFGTRWIDVVLPPAAMGPVVALIGLELSGNAAENAGLLAETIDPGNLIVFLVTLGVAVFGSILFRGFLSVIPILIAVICGYVAALACGMVDFAAVAAAPIFSMPNFSTLASGRASFTYSYTPPEQMMPRSLFPSSMRLIAKSLASSESFWVRRSTTPCLTRAFAGIMTYLGISFS